MKKFILRSLFIISSLCCGVAGYAQTNLYNYTVLSGTFVDLVSTGTVIAGVGSGAALDFTATSVPIGFSFSFCGTPYMQLSVSNHGWISLANDPSTIFTNTSGSIPGPGTLMNFWDDNSGDGSNWYYQTTGSSPNRVFTVQMTNIEGNPPFWTFATGVADMQIKLYETTNVIEYWYGPGTLTGSTSTIGIANGTGDYKTVDASIATATFGSFYVAHSTPPSDGTILRWSTCTVTATPSASAAVCPGGTVTLTATTSGTSWSWSGPGGFASSSLTPVLTGVTPAMAGTYVFSSTNGTCTTTATTVVTVNPTPPAPVLTPSVTTMCNGASLTITSSAAATWSPATNLFMDAGFTTPYTGASTATVYVHPTTVTTPTVFVYTATATNSFGCTSSAISTVTVNPATAAITGTMIVCTGFTTALSSTSPGGAWSSVTPAIGTVNSSTGVVTGMAPGTATILYTVAGCSSIAIVTVTPMPAAITGIMIACLGSTTTLSNTLPGGTWSSSNPSRGTVSTTGVVAGIAIGTTTITYDMGSGCYVTTTVSVNPVPTAILGASSVCIGATTTLTCSPTPGIWTATSVPAGVVNVNPITGVVTGLALGTATIRYTAGGCFVTTVMTVVSAASPIIGPASVCVGSCITLSTASSGGTWASSSVAVGTIGSSSGIMCGVSVGTTNITYALSAGCTTVRLMTVTPAPAAITGASSACQGQTTSLSHAVSGGTWISSDPSIATINISSGLVTAVSATPAPGTTTITYTTPSGCFTTMTFTVLPPPSPITGTLTLCQSATTALSSATSGGTWLSGTASVATVDASGVVTGAGPGTSIITYTAGTGCITTATVTVNGIPAPITGVLTVCPGQTTLLGSATAGGAWSSSDPSVGTISGTGNVAGITSGTTTITYTVPSLCYTTSVVTVTPSSAPILGSLGLCVGFTTSLTCASPGGWSSSDPSVASILSPGLIGGVSAGTATITCPSAASCPSTVVVTVNAAPAAIGGTLTVCAGQCTPLTNATAGGTWASGTPAVGTINSTTGLFCGIAAGTSAVTYSLGSGCNVTAVVSVNAQPSAISGTLLICAGSNTTLTSSPLGGTWLSGDLAVATIGVSSGTASGIAPGGTSVITYTAPSTCRSMATLTVNPLPAPVTGGTNICVGQTTTLSSATPGGTWSSSLPSAGSVSASGVVTGLAAGTTNIIYTVGGCTRSAVVVVNGLPSGVSGSLQVCEGSTTSLTGTPAGGTWQSINLAVGTITAGSGILAGLTAGTTNIIYTLPTTCSLTVIATVNPLPGTIGGVLTVCVGQTTTVNSTPSGTGTWSLSSGTGTATIAPATGVITGGTGGTVSVTYTLSTGCRRVATVTVYALPGIITGATQVCVNATTTLNCIPAGGTWTSLGGGIATVGVTTGVVTGIFPGTATIVYTLGTGCTRTTTVTVNPLPAPITGSLTTCVGQSTTLSNTSTPGVWSSANTAVGTVTSTTGIVTGVSGTDTVVIHYTLPTTCRMSATVTVYALPSAIGGSLQVCENATTALTTTTPGGTWMSGTASVGTIDAATGAFTGIMTGTSIVTYTLGTGCTRTAIVSVNSVPAGITGPTQVCEGATITLGNTTTPGTWSSGAIGTATVVPSTGVVTGISAGTVLISYTIPSGCRSTHMVTVHAIPSVITGAAEVCENATVVLSSTPPGGVWSSPNSTVAVNPVSGNVTGVTAGTATISYTQGIGCVRTTDITINGQPAAFTGNLGVCIGLTSLLSTTSSGGTWSSSNLSTAPVSSTGLVSGLALGTANIIYTLPVTGCTRSVEVTVNALPSPILGSDGFCNLSSTTYTSTPGGGTWSSANTSILTIDPATGVAYGWLPDTTDIVYTLGTGCTATKRVFLILAPYPITGPSDMCLGQSRTLSNAIGGGVWSSSHPVIASVDASTGVVTGGTLGVATITYVLSTGCYSVYDVTVNPIPTGIVGPLQICEGVPQLYTNTTPGGTWANSPLSVASIGSSSGILIGTNSGTTVITYTLGSGCNATQVITVNELPGVITGNTQVCEGSSTLLGTTSTAGFWSSHDPGVASIDALTGLMTGMSAAMPGILGTGMTIITYTLPTGCRRTQDVTVNPLPSPIVGAMNVCVGDMNLMSNATPGGGWLSSNPAVGTIDGVTGIFTGISGGVTIISYLLPTSCIATLPVTVHNNPSPITGSLTVCAGFSTNLSSGPTGGTWSQDPSSMGYGTIHTITGVVSGIVTGIIPVTYTMGSGCRAFNAVTVITLPAVISGPTKVCVDDSVVLSNLASGGVWTSSVPARATIDPVTGMVHGIAAGTTVITYTVGTGCFNILHMTVNPLPLPITGPLQVCEGATILLSSGPTPGGIWVSDTITTATVGYFTGIVTGMNDGVANISYVLGASGCLRAVQVTVNPTPDPIMGNPHVCIGASHTFTGTPTSGLWSSSNTSVATIDPVTGTVTSVSVGPVTITYQMLVTGCMATLQITVQPLPNVYTVTGGGSYCAGDNGVHIGLSGSQPGVSYVLYLGATATGYKSGTGFPLDFDLHTAAGVYTMQATNVTTGCIRNMAGSATVVVNPPVTPTVSIALTPYDSVCPGQPVTLSAVTTTGGSSPTYIWKVNGVSVSTASSYGFIPANGDVVSVAMHSSLTCVATPNANASRTLTVLPNVLPVAGVLTTPNDTICQYNPVTFTAAPTYGGAAPVYTWYVNGTMKGTGDSYMYIPVDGDVVTMSMISDYRCRTATTVTSGAVNMSVDSLLIPHVSIYVDPGFVVESGKPVTLHTSVTDAGANPKYQWKRNGHNIPGATLASYTGIFNDYDSVTCVVISGGVCNNIGTHDWAFISVAPLSTQGASAVVSDIRLVPNPNKGMFTIKGSFGSAVNTDVNMDVTDMLGQVVYRGVVSVKQGRVDTQVQLDNTLANGMYILTLRSGQEQKVFHFVMQQ